MNTNGAHHAPRAAQRVRPAGAAPIPIGTLHDRGIRALLCTADGIEQPELCSDAIDAFIAVERNLLWLDIDTTAVPDLNLLQEEFGFHELALEDALRPQQRAKIDTYDGFTFLIFYTVGIGGGPVREEGGAHILPPTQHGAADTERERQPLHMHQVALFVGANYLVTVHPGPLKEIDDIATRWRSNLDKIDRSIASLLYSLLDTIVDGYFPVIDHVADLVEEIEEGVFERFDETTLEEIFRLKKALLGMRRVVAPEREVLNVLIRRDSPLFGAQSVLYFQDVYDHLVRVLDSIDIDRDLLSSALDAYLSMSSNRLNQVMKSLTSWTIPLMAGALLAGIWGMNFEFMPELDERWGYLVALSLIAGAILGIVLYFRRKHWL